MLLGAYLLYKTVDVRYYEIWGDVQWYFSLKIALVEAYVIYLHVSSPGKSSGHPEKLSFNK